MKTDEKKELEPGTKLPDGRVYYGIKFPMFVPGSHHEVLTPEQQEERRKICEKARKFIKTAWQQKQPDN